jgi:hypothetical protein
VYGELALSVPLGLALCPEPLGLDLPTLPSFDIAAEQGHARLDANLGQTLTLARRFRRS